MQFPQDVNRKNSSSIKIPEVAVQLNSNKNANFVVAGDYQINHPNESKSSNNKKITRIKFTPNEDEELLHLVSIFGENDWTKISEEMAKKCLRKDSNGKFIIRSARQCKDRYMNYLSPEISNSEWTPEEDHLLELRVLFNPHKWKLIKEYFPGRSEVALRNRFNYIHKNYFSTIKPIINNQINSNTIFQQYTPNEIVQQAFDLRNKSIEPKVPSKTTNTSTDLLNTIKISSLQKLYKKFNKDPISDIIKNSPIPTISQDSVNHLYEAVKSEEMQNKVEYIKQELSSLSVFVENRAFFEMISRAPIIINDPGSDYDPFIMEP